jgi:biopolymer transport protein ExbD/biopolymer transport protein TolR
VMDRLATNGITHIAILTDSRSRPAAAGASSPAAATPALAAPTPAAAGGAVK